MRRVLIALVICLVPALSFAQGTDEQKIIAAVGKASSEMKLLTCDFVQTKHIRILNDKMVSRGKMYYQQPNMLRWEYTSPYTYTFVLNDNKVMLVNSGRTDVIDVDQNKMFKEIARLMMNSIVGKSLTDDKSFQTEISETPKEWIATMVPLKKDMKQMWTKLILHFDRSMNCVVKVEMHEKSGDYTVIDLSGIRINKPFDTNVFNVE